MRRTWSPVATAITEFQALVAAHPWSTGGLALAALGLLLLIALWRTRLRLGAAAQGGIGSGVHLEAWIRLGPVSLRVLREKGGHSHRVMTLAGIRCFDRPLAASAKSSRKAKSKKAKTQARKAASGPSPLDRLRQVRRHWSLLEIAQFAWSRRKDFQFHALSGRVEIGFEEPEYTGEFYGACCSLTPIVPRMVAGDDGSILAADLAIVPDWSLKDHLAGHIQLGMDIRVIRLACATAWFLLTHWHRAPSPSRRRRRTRVATA